MIKHKSHLFHELLKRMRNAGYKQFTIDVDQKGNGGTFIFVTANFKDRDGKPLFHLIIKDLQLDTWGGDDHYCYVRDGLPLGVFVDRTAFALMTPKDMEDIRTRHWEELAAAAKHEARAAELAHAN